MKPKHKFINSHIKTNLLGLIVLLISIVLAFLLANIPNVSGSTTINTNDGQLDSNWASTPTVTDAVNENGSDQWHIGEWDIISAWMAVDNDISPSTYFFRIEVASGPIGSGGTAQIDFDCNNNSSFDDPNIDLTLNYWIGYEAPYEGAAVWISSPGTSMFNEYTDDHAEAVGNNYELQANAADFCTTTPFSVRFRIGHGADTAVPISYPVPDINLVLDNGASETSQGFLFGANALQFLWFNRFIPAPNEFPFALDRVNIQWLEAESGNHIGDAIDVYIWEDSDGNPANGAIFRGSTSGTVQTTNGDFSTYSLAEPITFCDSTDILIGTVDRSVNSYVTGPKWPARIDSDSATSNRSWIATYTNDPGNPPVLPANGSLYEPINNGAWMIRGYGSSVPLSACGPVLTTNYVTGAPGSYFVITGAGYPENSTATISVNGHVIGTFTTDNNGEFSFLLSTVNSDEGNYAIDVSVNPSATTFFSLDINAPIHPQEGSGTVFPVPEGIALDKFTFLPAILR